MTKTISITFVAIAVVALALTVFASTVFAAKPASCNTIQSGNVVDSAGNPISAGYDEFGYNYQAHMFNGTYDSSDRKIDDTYWGDTGDYVDDQLRMKWSEDWLSNKDCDKTGYLDRGGDGTDGGSIGWLTNEVTGDYSDGNGDVRHYTEFLKIVWTGEESPLWGQYTMIQYVYNDPFGGSTGLFSKIGAPGFGLNDQWTTITP